MCQLHTFADLTAAIRVYNLRTDVKYVHKEKIFPIIIKHNPMNTYFGEDVSLHVLLKHVVKLGRDRWLALVNAVMNLHIP